MSITEAAKATNITKGALSYQIKQLESQLGFDVFERSHAGIGFTRQGQQLFSSCVSLFEQLEQQIKQLRERQDRELTVGMSTYFAARWLTPRLMRFTSAQPDIRLRIQTTVGRVAHNREQLDLAIEWGNGNWKDVDVERLFLCPAFVTAGRRIYKQLAVNELATVLEQNTLLHDFEGSSAWQTWFEKAGLPYQPHDDPLVIADPNVRVDAVAAGQGIALNDALIDNEIRAKKMYRLSAISLENHGYFLTSPANSKPSNQVRLFRDWIASEAESGATGI